MSVLSRLFVFTIFLLVVSYYGFTIYCHEQMFRLQTITFFGFQMQIYYYFLAFRKYLVIIFGRRNFANEKIREQPKLN